MKNGKNDNERAAASAGPRARLHAMITAAWTTQAISTSVRLGVFDAVGETPRSADEIARATGCDPAAMARLLRALSSLALVTEDDDGRYASTPESRLLRRDAPDSLAAWAELSGTRMWSSWAQLAESVRTGKSSRELATGSPGFGHLERNPREAELFNRAMYELTQPIAAATVAAFDFGDVRTVVDVGGGAGQLLAAILAANAHLRGILFDLPHAASMANEVLTRAGVGSRCEFVAGDFFERVPKGADLYLLKSVLHDWDDGRCATILSRCRAAMRTGARVLVIERAMPVRYSDSALDRGIARSDLNMLVGPGGRERTEAEYHALFRAADLRPGPVVALPGGFALFEATAP